MAIILPRKVACRVLRLIRGNLKRDNSLPNGSMYAASSGGYCRPWLGQYMLGSRNKNLEYLNVRDDQRSQRDRDRRSSNN